MLQRINENSVPPGGYQVEDPDLKIVFKASSFDKFLDGINRARVANHLVGFTMEQLEDLLCRRMPAGVCHDPTIKSPVGTASPTMERVIRASMRWKFRMQKANRSPVDINVANDRGGICMACPENIRTAGCSSCNGMGHAKKALLREFKTTAYDSKLHMCAIDGCLNQLKVHMDDKTILEEQPQVGKGFPEECWLRKRRGQLCQK